MRALVIIPTYNEGCNVEPLIQQILEVGDYLSVLVVDDNSPDGTGQIVEKIAGEEPRVSLLHRQSKQGLGTAYCAGFSFALSRNFDLILTMDGDLSHSPDYIPALIGVMGDADLAIGSRYVRGGGLSDWGLYRRLLSRSANFFARGVLRLRVRDCTSGFRCYRRELLKKIGLEEIVSDGYSFLVEILFRCLRAGFMVVEVPIVFTDRQRGKSKISKKEIFKGAFTLLRLRRGPGERRPFSVDNE